MGHWNHRVVKRVYPARSVGKIRIPKETVYGIHETYYGLDGKGKPPSITLEAIETAESIPALRKTLQRMLRALNKPVLDYDTRKEISA
jgi:hypothetical protein